MMSEPAVESAIRDLVLANRMLSRENVIDGFADVSARDPTNPHRYFLSRTLNGEPVGDDARRMYAEQAIHGAIYPNGAQCSNQSPEGLGWW